MTRSQAFKVALAICAALGALDIAGLAGFASSKAPPAAVIIGGAVLGLITLVAVRRAWRDRPGGIVTVIASRLVSALLGIPVFFAHDAPQWARGVVGASTAVTVVAVGVILGARRTESRLMPGPAGTSAQ